MKIYLALLLTCSILLQPLSKLLIVSNYAVNKKAITAKYCVNKAKPKLKCNGKCHLKKQLIQHDKQSKQDNTASNESIAFQWYVAVSPKLWAPHLELAVYIDNAFVGKETDPYTLSLFRPPTC